MVLRPLGLEGHPALRLGRGSGGAGQGTLALDVCD